MHNYLCLLLWQFLSLNELSIINFIIINRSLALCSSWIRHFVFHWIRVACLTSSCSFRRFVKTLSFLTYLTLINHALLNLFTLHVGAGRRISIARIAGLFQSSMLLLTLLVALFVPLVFAFFASLFVSFVGRLPFAALMALIFHAFCPLTVVVSVFLLFLVMQPLQLVIVVQEVTFAVLLVVVVIILVVATKRDSLASCDLWLSLLATLFGLGAQVEILLVQLLHVLVEGFGGLLSLLFLILILGLLRLEVPDSLLGSLFL